VKLQSNMTLVTKLVSNKKFRDAFVSEHIRNGIPFQIRAMREERKWTQGKLGESADKPRNVITRIEDPNYGKLTITTLLEIASAFEVALLVKFVPFHKLLREYEDTSSVSLSVSGVSQEARQLAKWAREKDKAETKIVDSDTVGTQLLFDLGEANAINFTDRPTARIIAFPTSPQNISHTIGDTGSPELEDLGSIYNVASN
jgi:hypothetical protein